MTVENKHFSNKTKEKNKVTIIVYTDNTSTMYAINKGTIRCKQAMAWLRITTDACLHGRKGHFNQDWFCNNWAVDYPQFHPLLYIFWVHYGSLQS